MVVVMLRAGHVEADARADLVAHRVLVPSDFFGDVEYLRLDGARDRGDWWCRTT